MDEVIKKSSNSNLQRAKKAKNDEFYTQLSTITEELSNYDISLFKDKVIYLPFDVAVTDGAIKQSQFVKYFQMNTHRFQYKKLIATCLADKSNTKKINKYIIKRSKVAYCTEENQRSGVSPVAEVVADDGTLCYEYKDGSRRQLAKEVVNEVVRDESGVLLNADSHETWTNQFWRYTDNLEIIDQDDDYDVSLLQCSPDAVYGSGDFRSAECCKYLEEADIVISNPPFSLFKEVFQWLDSSKNPIKFLLLGSINEINFENIFDLFKDGLCWRGYTIRNGHTKFLVPSDYSTIGEASSMSEDGKLVEVGVRWYTNLDERSKTYSCSGKRWIDLYKNYDASEYDFYDDSDVLHVAKTADMPKDFDGLMGVPVSFLDHWNPDQFELVGWACPSRSFGVDYRTKLNGTNVYARLIVRRRDYGLCS